MYQRKLKQDIRGPLEYGLSVLGGKWNSRILCILGAQGPLRYSALRDALGNVTDAVLSAALRSLRLPGSKLKKGTPLSRCALLFVEMDQ